MENLLFMAEDINTLETTWYVPTEIWNGLGFKVFVDVAKNYRKE